MKLGHYTLKCFLVDNYGIFVELSPSNTYKQALHYYEVGNFWEELK